MSSTGPSVLGSRKLSVISAGAPQSGHDISNSMVPLLAAVAELFVTSRRERRDWRALRPHISIAEPIPPPHMGSAGSRGVHRGYRRVNFIQGVVEVETQPAARGRVQPESVVRERGAVTAS